MNPSQNLNSSAVAIVCASVVIEWLEYALYIYLAILFGQAFFSFGVGDSLTFAFLFFALTYWVRPLGAWLYGYYSDTRGRRLPMLVSIVLIGIATLVIALIPEYSSIGFWAPFGLLVARMVQSFSVAGEFTNTAVYLMEHAPEKRRVLAGALVAASSALGMGLGLLLTPFIFSIADEGGYWRWPFLVCGCITLFLCFARHWLLETPMYLSSKQVIEKQVKTKGRNRLFSELWVDYKLSIIKVLALAAFVSVFVYVGNGFFSYYLTQVLIWDLSSVNFGLAVSLFIVSVLAMLWAWLMKPSSVLSFLTFGILLMVIVAPGMFISSASDNIWFFAFYLGYILANSFVTATMFCYMFSLLPTHVRCTGMSVAWNVSVALFGGTALLVAEFLTKNIGYFMPGWYITVIGLMSLCILHGPDLYNKMTNKRI